MPEEPNNNAPQSPLTPGEPENAPEAQDEPATRPPADTPSRMETDGPQSDSARPSAEPVPAQAAPSSPSDSAEIIRPEPDEAVADAQSSVDALGAIEAAELPGQETVSDASEPSRDAPGPPSESPSVTAPEEGAREATESPPDQVAERSPGAATQVSDSSTSKAEVEAAMQDMLVAAERRAGDESSGEPAATGVNAVSPEEIEAAMQEMLETAERSANGGGETERAGGAPIDGSVSGGAREADGSDPDQPTPRQDLAAGFPEEAPSPDTTSFVAPELSGDATPADASQIELLDDVELDVKIELGRAEMYIADVLGLGTGSVVELDKAAGDPVDIFVNDRLVARGEVLVLNDNFCVRINDIISPIPELESDG